jgi:hypothetical protein
MTPTAQICKNVGPMDNAMLKPAPAMTIAYAVMPLVKTMFVT